MEFFASVTAPQAELIGAVLGFASVMFGAVLAPIVFFLLTRDGVADFKTAVKAVTKSAEDVEKATTLVTVSANDVKAATDGIARDLETLKSNLLQINEAVSGVQSASALAQARFQEEVQELRAEATEPTRLSDEEQRLNDDMRKQWSKLQELVEGAASDVDIDGRTRAKYARIDRRNYERLAVTLYNDGHLPGSEDQWRKVIDLWNKSKRNRHQVSPATVAEFRKEVDDIFKAEEGANASDEHLADVVCADACAGRISTPLTFEVLRAFGPYGRFEDSYLRSLLPNYAEGGHWHRHGQRARFRRVAIGQYAPICQ